MILEKNGSLCGSSRVGNSSHTVSGVQVSHPNLWNKHSQPSRNPAAPTDRVGHRKHPERPRRCSVHTREEFRRSKSRGDKIPLKRRIPVLRDFIGRLAGSPGSELGRSSAFPSRGRISHSFCPFLKFLLPAWPCPSCLLGPESPQDPSHPCPRGLGKCGHGCGRAVFLRIV